MKIVISATLAAAALILSGQAHADDPTCTSYHPCQKPGTPTRYYSGDELDYLGDLDRMKIPYTDSPAAVDMAHTICRLNTPDDDYKDSTTKLVQAQWTAPITNNQAQWVVIAAEGYVCPYG